MMKIENQRRVVALSILYAAASPFLFVEGQMRDERDVVESFCSFLETELPVSFTFEELTAVEVFRSEICGENSRPSTDRVRTVMLHVVKILEERVKNLQAAANAPELVQEWIALGVRPEWPGWSLPLLDKAVSACQDGNLVDCEIYIEEALNAVSRTLDNGQSLLRELENAVEKREEECAKAEGQIQQDCYQDLAAVKVKIRELEERLEDVEYMGESSFNVWDLFEAILKLSIAFGPSLFGEVVTKIFGDYEVSPLGDLFDDIQGQTQTRVPGERKFRIAAGVLDEDQGPGGGFDRESLAGSSIEYSGDPSGIPIEFRWNNDRRALYVFLGNSDTAMVGLRVCDDGD